MKKINRQKLTLIGLCILFAALLLLSIKYSSLNMNTGNILQPRLTNTK